MIVYVSSSFSDLREYREVAFDTLRRLDDVVVTAVEQFSAGDAFPVEACIEQVRRADAIIVLLGFRYGFVPSGYENSITEIEYNAARIAGKPVFAFLLSDAILVRVTDIEQDEILRRKLSKFRSEILRTTSVALISSADEFRVKLSVATF